MEHQKPRQDKWVSMCRFAETHIGRQIGRGFVLCVRFREYDNGHWRRELVIDHPDGLGLLAGGPARWVGHPEPRLTGRVLEFC